MQAFERAKAEFDRRMQITPARIRALLERAGIGNAADAIPVTGLEDALLFSAILARAAQDGFTIAGFRVTPLDGRAENDWIDVGNFKVERIGDAEGV